MKNDIRKSCWRKAFTLVSLLTFVLGSVPTHNRVAADSPLPFTVVGEERFGINFVNSAAVNATSTAATVDLRYRQAIEAGARWTRWPLYWHEIEVSQGSRDYSEYDALLELDRANGLQSNVILMGTPSWASTSGSADAPLPKIGDRSPKSLITPSGIQLSSAISPPRNLNLPWNDPNNHWGKFVYETVLRYKDRVTIWELWNEPDLRWGGIPVFWNGSESEYYQLLKVGYQAVKAADPQATVLFAGIAFWGNESFFQNVLEYIRNDSQASTKGFYFDIIPLHPYISPIYVWEWPGRVREQMQSKLGVVKPVWVNEANIPVCGEWPTSCSPGDTWRATLDEQASYVIQAYAYAFAASVNRLSIFQLRDDGLAPTEYYGLSTNSGSTRPAALAYQVAATYLYHPTSVTRSPGSGYEMIVLEGTPQGKVTVVWATQGSDVQVNVPAASLSAYLIDQAANSSQVTPSGGNYRFTLPRATNNRDPSGRYIVGGKPYLLVEPSLVLTGRVTDNRAVTVGSASVSAVSTPYATSMGANGSYRLAIPYGAFDLIAGASGWGTIPARRLSITGAMSYNFVLPPVVNHVQNWGFEEVGGWTTSGVVTTTTEWMHSGTKSTKLGEWGNDGGGSISQSSITIPAGTYKPTLSFLYAVPTPPGASDTFLVEVASSTGTVTHSVPLDTQSTWAHRWLDLNNASGPITLTFRLNKTGASNLRVFLDEVSVGKASGGPNELHFPTIRKG